MDFWYRLYRENKIKINLIKMKKNRQSSTLNENNLILEKNNIMVYKEKNNTYYFESQRSNLNYFYTCDYLESVSALIKIKDIKDFDLLWDMEITDEMRSMVNYGSSLYWLSGGDNAWNSYRIYNIRWDEAIDLFLEEYNEILIKINTESKTLRDAREMIKKHLNLPKIYEFSLENNITN